MRFARKTLALVKIAQAQSLSWMMMYLEEVLINHCKWCPTPRHFSHLRVKMLRLSLQRRCMCQRSPRWVSNKCRKATNSCIELATAIALNSMSKSKLSMKQRKDRYLALSTLYSRFIEGFLLWSCWQTTSDWSVRCLVGWHTWTICAFRILSLDLPLLSIYL